MLEPFPKTLEDHTKHKGSKLCYIPLFPPSLSPESHQLINEHNAFFLSSLSLSRSPLQYVDISSFCSAAQKLALSKDVNYYIYLNPVAATFMQAPHEVTSS